MEPHSKPAPPCSKHKQVLNERKLFKCWLHIHENNLLLFLCKSQKNESHWESNWSLAVNSFTHSLKAFFLNSKLFFLPSQKKTSSRQRWAHTSSYSTLKSKVYAWQLLSWNFPEALPALLPRKAKPSQCLFELNLRFKSIHADLRTNSAWHISSLLVICSTKELGMVISNSDPTSFSKWLLSVRSFWIPELIYNTTKEQRIQHPFQENLLSSIKLYNKNGANYFYLAETAEHKTLWPLQSK